MSTLADYYAQNIVGAFRFFSSPDPVFKEFIKKQLESVSRRRMATKLDSNLDSLYQSLAWLSDKHAVDTSRYQ